MVAASVNEPASSRDSFGCPFSKLYKDQTLTGGNLKLFRKGTRDLRLEQVETPASDRGFLVGISTQGGHSRRIFHQHHATDHAFEENSVYIRNLADDYRADLSGPFDFLLLEISPKSLIKISEEADLGGVNVFSGEINGLAGETGLKDPVLANLARALIPAFEHPEQASALFIDQMATAIGTYLVHQYGGRHANPILRSRKLSRAHESLAKNILLENLDGNISISEVAGACRLSRGYFIKAFRETTGQTPYQWLLAERIRRACELLKQPKMPLAEIAIACGFADQSHFTRVFANVIGATPGNWRRGALV
jgi:AraC family transcriptional regulator